MEWALPLLILLLAASSPVNALWGRVYAVYAELAKVYAEGGSAPGALSRLAEAVELLQECGAACSGRAARLIEEAGAALGSATSRGGVLPARYVRVLASAAAAVLIGALLPLAAALHWYATRRGWVVAGEG